MSLEITDPNQIQAAASFDAQAAVADEVQASRFHDIKLGGNEFQTDIPKGLNLFLTDFDYPVLNLGELDRLEPGTYGVRGEIVDRYASGQEQTQKLSYNFNVVSTPEGKALNSSYFGDWVVGKGTEQLMESLGFVVENDPQMNFTSQMEAIPTPNTLKKAAIKLGVDIEFFPDIGTIKGLDYLRVISEGKYPVSFKNYQHDIEDDHLTAMVLGGEPLKIALKNVALQALGEGKEAIEGYTRLIDGFTAKLRGAIADGPVVIGGSRNELRYEGKYLGMTEEVVDNILETARKKALEFGMIVRYG